MSAELKLAEIISARLCHDLAGPIGTLTNSLEMIEEGGPDAAEALEIAQDAMRSMHARLRYIRAAWGRDDAELDAASIRDYCAALPQARKVTFELTKETGPFPATLSRALLNITMLAIEALPRGGTVTIAGTSLAEVLVSIRGERAAWPTGLAALLSEGADPLSALTDSRSLQTPLTALIARGAGVTMRFLPGSENGTPPLLIASQND